jgi:hypothetical protein
LKQVPNFEIQQRDKWIYPVINDIILGFTGLSWDNYICAGISLSSWHQLICYRINTFILGQIGLSQDKRFSLGSPLKKVIPAGL